MRTIALDTETFYSNEFTVKTLGYWKYARDPRCNPYLISVCDGSEVWAGEPKDFNFDSLAGANLVSHNSAFDEDVCLAATEAGLFEVPGLKMAGMDHWFCSANMSAYLWNMRSLAEAARMGLGVDVNKGVRDKAKGKTPVDMKREGWWNEMVKYAAADAQVCWQLWDKHNAKWPQFERRLSRLTIDQGRHGIAIDLEALDTGISLLQKVIFSAQQSLPWVLRGKKPASPIGLAEDCKLAGIPPPPVKAHDPEAAEAWEAQYAPHFPFVMALRNLRKAKKTLATLETIKLRIREDGTIAFSLKYAGAHTLRWAGDAGFNLQNMNREPLFIDPKFSFIFDKKLCREYADEFDREHVGKSATGELVSGIQYFDMRGLILARPGMVLAPVDSAQIEPRVLNHIAGNTTLLEKVAQGMAIYEAFARDSLGWKGGELKKEDKKKYSMSKAQLLGLGFRMGWEKFIIAAWTLAGVDITEGDEDFARGASVDGRIHFRMKQDNRWVYLSQPEGCEQPMFEGPATFCERCVFVKVKKTRKGVTEETIVPLPVYGMRSRLTVAAYRASNPLVEALWKAMDAALEASVGEDLVVRGPHGGTLTYRKVKTEHREMENKDTGEKYTRKVYTAEIGGKRYVLHGGILTENLVQWVARMVFAERMLALHDRIHSEDPRQWVLFSVHDEAVPEILEPANPEATRKQIEAELSVTPDWLAGCPLGAECKITKRYLK